MAKKQQPEAAQAITFEESLEELEQIVVGLGRFRIAHVSTSPAAHS